MGSRSFPRGGLAKVCKGLKAMEVGLGVSYHTRKAAGSPSFGPDEYWIVFISSTGPKMARIFEKHT